MEIASRKWFSACTSDSADGSSEIDVAYCCKVGNATKAGLIAAIGKLSQINVSLVGSIVAKGLVF